MNALGIELEQHGLKFVRIDGDSSLEQQLETIDKFRKDPAIVVMLLTLVTGSAGLNLTEASYVHILEPHWNPMVEEQAAARVHRIGQTKDITVYRYIVENSIKERVRVMQTKKLHLAHLVGVKEDFMADQANSNETGANSLEGLLDRL